MRTRFTRYLFLTILCLALASLPLVGLQSSSQQPSSQDQAQQPAENPPHVDQQTNPDDRKLESSIRGKFHQDPHMAYSNVRVHVTDNEVLLTGTVLTNTAKDQAEQIAGEHAKGRKITNHIRVNPNIHPGPGM